MLVEDSRDYREIVAMALTHETDIELTGQFSTAEIALRNLQAQPPAEHPALILLDLRLPGMDGLEALPRFLAIAPGAKIVVLTQSKKEADVLRAISRGAAGYLLKSSTVSQINEGIHTVMAGGASLDAGVARFILDRLKARLPKAEAEQLLTERELEILTLLAEGLVKKEIADRLNISYTTVDSHVAHIYEKLGVRNAPAAVNKAYLVGLFQSRSQHIDHPF
jgi:DNA-binding NarL/FixJ family response regulator